jgi:hypothetical protein
MNRIAALALTTFLSAFFSVAAAPVAFAAPDDDRTVADCSWKLNENDGSTKLVLFVHFGDLKNMSPQDCNQVVELIGKIFEKIGYDYETRIISKKKRKVRSVCCVLINGHNPLGGINIH